MERDLKITDAALKDPVCGMDVQIDSKHEHVHDFVKYRFCASGCAKKFAHAPDFYLSGGHKKVDVPEGTIFTCPMLAHGRIGR